MKINKNTTGILTYGVHSWW